ncbi:variable surface lipoprotein [Mycoplasmopsis bovis]|nr:variable surface lipoprotein [Mycoplasmopsis bovis]QQH36186.1 variable surface lipoprotein [Mycoplasmopsis bovis]
MIKKIISIGSLSSLLLMPLVAASCKKNDNDWKSSNNKSTNLTRKLQNRLTPPILLMIMMISLIKMRKQTTIKI